MLNKTIEILEEFVDEGVEVHPDAKLIADLGLNSFDVMNIVVAFEDEFDIEVPDKTIRSFQTVRDIANFIQENA